MELSRIYPRVANLATDAVKFVKKEPLVRLIMIPVGLIGVGILISMYQQNVSHDTPCYTSADLTRANMWGHVKDEESSLINLVIGGCEKGVEACCELLKCAKTKPLDYDNSSNCIQPYSLMLELEMVEAQLRILEQDVKRLESWNRLLNWLPF